MRLNHRYKCPQEPTFGILHGMNEKSQRIVVTHSPTNNKELMEYTTCSHIPLEIFECSSDVNLTTINPNEFTKSIQLSFKMSYNLPSHKGI